MDATTIKDNLRKAISNFCRWRVNQGICEPDECDICPCNAAYDMARDDMNDEDDDEIPD